MPAPVAAIGRAADYYYMVPTESCDVDLDSATSSSCEELHEDAGR